MYQFTLYNHDWKEHFDPSVMNHYMKAMKGPIEITELEVTGDCFDYCIHTEGLDERTVQQVADAWKALSDHDWVLQREEPDEDILNLKDEEEIEYLIDLYLSR